MKRTIGSQRATTLVEATIALAIAGIVIGGMVGAFLTLVRSSEASTRSMASTALAIQGYEQLRGAKWDALSFPAEDELQGSNFPPVGLVLAPGGSESAAVYATNYTSISLVSTNPLLKLIKVDCVYGSHGRGFVTNSVFSYRASETGQQNAQQIGATTSSTTPGGGTTAATNSRTVVASAAKEAEDDSTSVKKVTYWSLKRNLRHRR